MPNYVDEIIFIIEYQKKKTLLSKTKRTLTFVKIFVTKNNAFWEKKMSMNLILNSDG